MNINLNSAITIILGLLALIGSIYRLAQVESNINLRISIMEHNLIKKIDLTERKIDIHLTQYQGDKENIYEYRMNSTDQLINHKFNRLASWINQISGYLNKEGNFQIRDDKF
jgi:hypothetical protein